MTIIEQIKAEIEKRQKENFEQKGQFAAGKTVEDADILSFLDTLESEKPMNQKGLEEEIIKCWQEWISPSNEQSEEGVLSFSEFAFYARHFAKWQKEQMLKKHIPKEHSELTELEYAFYDLLASNNITNHSDEEVVKTAKDTAMDLMNIAKAEMMKKAVKGEILDLGINYLDLSLIDAEKIGIKEGDKVRIIIVKED